MNRRALARVARRHGLRLIVLFGSRAQGRARPDSDSDVCVIAPNFRGDELALAGELGAALGTPADVVFFHRADPVLKYHAVAQGRLLYGRPGEFARARLQAVKAWQDCRKIDDARKASLERRL